MPKDERIARYQKDILNYLVKEKQFRDTTEQISLENYKDRMIIRRCFEIFTYTSANGILLVKFQANVDHCDKFWGILNEPNEFKTL